MTAPTELRTAALRPAHATAAERLSAEAGWNQTVDDWRCMIEIGEAWGQFAPSGDLVASALLLPYGGRLAWVGMVLTTAAWRRRGLATLNLRGALARCEALGLTAGLDATPAGREVYRPLGFRDLWPLHRLLAPAPQSATPAPGDLVIRPAAPGDLDEMVALDAAAFGAPRRDLMTYLLRARPGCAHVALRQGRVAGFVLARDGRLALHLGPVIAPDAGSAAALVAHALRNSRGPVSIDVPDRQAPFLARLAAAGFAPARPFTRMLRGAVIPGAPGSLFALAGPEFG